MRVRFYSYFYPPCVGGGEVILQHQAEGLAARGHEVHVHTTTYTNLNLAERTAPGSTREEGVRVHRRPSVALPFPNPLEQDALTPAFLADAWLPADLLVCVGYPSVHLAALSARARATGTPLLVQNYVTADFLGEILGGAGGWNKRVRARLWKGPVRRALARARRVIADSPGAARGLCEGLGLDNVVFHVGMAVDPDEFDAVGANEVDAVRARFRLGADRVVLAPSRLAPQKGADWLVEAALPLLEIPGWRLVIPGAVNDAAFAAQVRAAARPFGDRVVFGPVDRATLVALFKAASVVVLPSRGETVGGVVFEGMWAGALAIVSDAVEAARDAYLRDGENGLLVPVGDVGALRDALRRALTDDLPAVRAAGRAMVEAEYTWDASVGRLERLYTEAVRGG